MFTVFLWNDRRPQASLRRHERIFRAQSELHACGRRGLIMKADSSKTAAPLAAEKGETHVSYREANVV